MSKWKKKAVRTIDRLAAGYQHIRRFCEANLEAVESALAGKGPDATQSDPQSGVRAVVNIASVHVPDFCQRSANNTLPAYCNSYDLGRASVRVGDVPKKSWKKREIVDSALKQVHGGAMDKVYYAAAELNGAGIRFYGDVCLVLKPSAIADDTKVLDRNSYDVMRAPLRDVVEKMRDEGKKQAVRIRILEALSGTFANDLQTIAGIKVLVTTGERDRRLSTGQISGGVLDDEDYIEILKMESFNVNDLDGARLSVADSAIERHVEQQIAFGTATHSERLWLRERREAVRSLAQSNVGTSIVATVGRIRS